MSETTARTRCYASERNAVIWLMGVCNILEAEVLPGLWNRSGRIKWCRRDLSLLKTLAEKVIDRILSTVPREQLLNFQRDLKNCYYSVGVKSVTGRVCDPDAGRFLTYEQFDTLMAEAVGKCALCDKSEKEERDCPFRKLRDTLGSDKKHESGCDYKWEY